MSIRRILLVQRDLNDQPVPPHRRGASVAGAVAQLGEICRSQGVELITQDELVTDLTQGASIDFVLVLGGDGTILRAAELAREQDVPLLGVNTGHVGFLAEADPEALEQVVAEVVAGRYTVEKRMTLRVEVEAPDGAVTRDWALNETALEKRDRARMLEVAIGVDGQAVSSFGCDALLISTPTCSTAYAFSAGGPVIWPEVEALLLVPVAAHALFTRPLVLGTHSTLEVVIKDAGFGAAEIWCDGRRWHAVPSGSTVRVTRATRPVRLARLNDAPFSQRLVRKFNLPVSGWRVPARGPRRGQGERTA